MIATLHVVRPDCGWPIWRAGVSSCLILGHTSMNVWLTGITDDMGDFVISDESDTPSKSKKRKRPAAKSAPAPRKRYASSPTPAQGVDVDEDESLPDVPSTSTAQQWLYDPNNITPQKEYKVAATPTPRTSTFKIKERACDKEPSTLR